MTTSYRINDTTSYHRDKMKTLGWELTVCNALEEPSSPCRAIVRGSDSFGSILFRYLSSIIPFDAVSSIIEIGGGHGYLMRDFLLERSFPKATMMDLSPVLLGKQKQTLKGYSVEFFEEDFFTADREFLGTFDLLIMNEVAGDFPTLCGISPDIMSLPDDRLDAPLLRTRNMLRTYSLPVPGTIFNLNIGAIEAVERVCSAGVRFMYMSEHSCEARVPEALKNKLYVSGSGNPERIQLMGHDEYTVRFSDLEKAAGQFGYRVVRGQYSDFITYEHTDRINFILTSGSSKDEHEIIRQFIEDLYTYEYLVLMRD